MSSGTSIRKRIAILLIMSFNVMYDTEPEMASESLTQRTWLPPFGLSRRDVSALIDPGPTFPSQLAQFVLTQSLSTLPHGNMDTQRAD